MFATINSFNHQIIDETIRTLMEQPARRFKSLICFDCGEVFLFEPDNTHNRNFNACSEHWDITKLFEIGKYYRRNL